MKVKCEYCRQMIDEGQAKCPYCGATISAVNRVSDKQPKTIEELKEWYSAHNLPPENVTRFFIGKDIKEPKAFGIYKEVNGDFVVYKNKADGSRAIRYQGVDEGYAVNELYQRLRAEIADQKSHNSHSSDGVSAEKLVKNIFEGLKELFTWLFGLFAFVLVISGIIAAFLSVGPSKGYYRYNNQDYYFQNARWYVYDALADNWSMIDKDDDDELFDTITDDTEDEYSTTFSGGKSFEDTSWYDDGSSDDSSDWDSDSSWDSSDSWDSGSTDWDSDW